MKATTSRMQTFAWRKGSPGSSVTDRFPSRILPSQIVGPSFGIEGRIAATAGPSSGNIAGAVGPDQRRKSDQRQIERSQDHRLDGVAILMDHHMHVIGPHEQEYAHRHGRRQIPSCQQSAVKKAAFFFRPRQQDVQPYQKTQDVLNNAPGQLYKIE